ncbi:MAG TPA: anthrone oxygenase family protein, partial [Rubrobacter sp.]|nr:anthrone oxygenase family protein [Rubrobacter sp.]
IVSSFLVWGEPVAGYLLAGGALYLLGTIGPTGVYHVPRNEALAEIEPSSSGAEDHWSRYLRGWTAWNHLRFAAALGASATLIIALRVSHV